MESRACESQTERILNTAKKAIQPTRFGFGALDVKEESEPERRRVSVAYGGAGGVLENFGGLDNAELDVRFEIPQSETGLVMF